MAMANKFMKRKRNEPVAPSRVRRNPFLDTDVVSLGLADDETFQNVTSFLQQTQHSIIQCNVDGELVPVSLASTVDSIVSGYSNHRSNSSSLSTQDISSLIIPWAAKCLLFLSVCENARESDLKILWKSLALSIDGFLSAEESAFHDLHQTLSTQMVNKLIPFAVKSAFSTNDTSISIHSARAFTLLTESFFRPTFEFCCSVLLVDLAAHVGAAAAMNHDHLELPNQDLNSIVLSSLRLLRTLQRLGVSSPKKMFQTLTKGPVLLAVSKLALIRAADQNANAHQLAMEVLWEAFFSSVHHIEGYRALKIDLGDVRLESTENGRQHVFRCYQGDLLDNVSSLVGSSVDDAETQALCQLVASLVEGFFTQAFVWQRDFHSQTTSKEISSTSTMIFRVWGVMTGTVLRKLESRRGQDNGKLMNSLTSCLKALLEHNAYHSTFEDKDQHHFLFLKSMSTRLLSLLTPETSISGLDGLVCMVQLNHLLVHEDLSKIIAHAASSSLPGGTDSFHLFICTLFKTYQDLRQLDYLVEAIVASTGWLTTSSAYAVLQGALDDANVARKIAVAVSAAPHGQSQALFDVFNSRIVKEAPPDHADDVHSIETISMVSALFILLLRNLRVDEHTSKRILSLCDESLAGSGSSLLAMSKTCSPLVKHGIRLCGWILDLRNRCSFWLPNDDELSLIDLPEALVTLLENLREDSTDLDLVVDAPQELQFLACYRIQQLHSLIHQQTLNDFSRDSGASPHTEGLLAEVRRLVMFVFSNASNIDNAPLPSSSSLDVGTAKDPWILLGQFLPAWAPYCDDVNVRVFLRWVFWALSGLDAGISHLNASKRNVRTLPPNAEAKQTVKAMLLDFSFLENRHIASRFVMAGILHVEALIAADSIEDNLHSCHTDNCTWREVPDAIRSAFIRGIATSVPNVDRSNALPSLQAALKILNVLNATPSGWRRCGPVGMTLGHLLAVDVSVRFLVTGCTINKGFVSAGLKVLAGTRSILSKTILESDHLIARSFLCSGDWPFSLINAVFVSAIEISRCCCPTRLTPAFRELLVSSGELVESVLLTCLDDDTVEALSRVARRSAFPSTVHRDEIYRYLILRCAKGVMRGGMEDLSVPTGITFARSILDDAMTACLDTTQGDAEEKSLFALFLGGLASISPTDNNSVFIDIIQKEIESIDISRNANDFNFLAGVLLHQNRADSIAEGLYQRVASSKSFEFVDDTVLCRLVAQIPMSDFINFLDYCSRHRAPGKSEQGLRILRLLLATTDQPERREAIASVGARILARAIDGLRVDECKQSRAAADLLIELTAHKDLVCLKERDIARILSQLCCSLRSVNSTDILDSDEELFYMCCGLVASLMQRFPKQLYTCVASLTQVLQNLFQVVFAGKQNGSQVMGQSRAIFRLCEMLGSHKDILKKHVLGLILDFVEALKNDMVPSCKKALTPAVYSILEMLSEYEVSQLNALLDTTSKALFRSFYDGFRKWHVYRGRF
jgi:hypothetical protein